jgi:septation ring formation regulator EzrA
MNIEVAIISAVIGIVSLILAIFGASWLNQRATEKLVDQLEKRFDSKFDVTLIEVRRLDQRFDSIETRLDKIERQLEAIFKPILPS